jgi:hypothetical protein
MSVAIALGLALGTLAATVPTVPRTGAAPLVAHLEEGVSVGKVGDWVTFLFKAGEERGGYLRLSLVAEEKDVRGRPAVWVEIELGEHPEFEAPLAQVRLLCAKGNALRRDAVTRAIVAMGAEKPTEIRPEDVPAVFGPSPRPARSASSKDPEVRTQRGKPAALMTPAGTVQGTPVSLYFRDTLVERVWLSPQIPILGLARWEMPGLAHQVEVQGFGTAAKGRMVLPSPKAPKIRLEPGHE